jgi:hypothetical protein
MSQQILAPSAASVWSREQCDFIEDIDLGGRTMVSWRGAKWLLKFKDESTNEVIGYQLAEFLGLPLQPWLAVEIGEIEETGVERPNIGLLVQRWDEESGGCRLEYPASSHPTLVGTALALACFIPPDMEWMTNATLTEFRLIDLEGCGPAITFIERISWNDLVDGYLNCVRANVCDCYRAASGVESAFCSALARLVEADLMGIVSFGGHSRADEITKMVASFLKPAQKLLSYFCHGFTL